MKKQKQNSSNYNVKYTSVNKDEHHILMDDLYDTNQSIMHSNKEKAFDFSSIQEYKSIYTYKNNTNFHQQNGSLINGKSMCVI